MGVAHQTTVCRQAPAGYIYALSTRNVVSVNMSDVFGDGVFSTDSSDEWSCSSHSFDEHAVEDDEENWTIQPYQFEPEIDEEESKEMCTGRDNN